MTDWPTITVEPCDLVGVPLNIWPLLSRLQQLNPGDYYPIPKDKVLRERRATICVSEALYHAPLVHEQTPDCEMVSARVLIVEDTDGH